MITVLLIDPVQVDIAAARDAFETEGGDFRLNVADTLADGLRQISAGGVDIVLMYLHLPDTGGLHAVETILQSFPEIPLIVLGDKEDAELALRAVRAGAHDYLVKGRLSRAALLRCVRHAVERHRALVSKLKDSLRTPGGKVIAFIGAKGGVGTTTSLLNTAAALARAGRRIIAAELRTASNFAIQLSRRHLIDFGDLLQGEHEINPTTVQERLVQLPFGFHALYAPPRSSDACAISPQQANALIESAAELAEIVLVDLPAQISQMHSGALASADYVLVVLEPDCISVNFAAATITVLEQWKIDPLSNGLLIVNRSGLANTLRPQQVRERLGREVVGIIPPAGEGCLVAFESGQPLYVAQPESRFGHAVAQVAENLAQSPVRTLRL